MTEKTDKPKPVIPDVKDSKALQEVLEAGLSPLAKDKK